MGRTTINVLLVDDHAMVREGLAALVADDPGIRIVGQCGDGLKVFEQVARLRPDVAVIDIALPGLNGLEVCRHLSSRAKDTAVLILTMYDDEQFVAKALENGASGYLTKESAGEQLSEAIRTVARGQMYLGPNVSSAVLKRAARDGKDSYETLTTRERQVLHMIAEGKTNSQIAAELDVSIKTVDTHRLRLTRKLDIHDQTGLVRYVLRRGIIPLE